MTLAAGARLGPYEILSPLGAGGMGEVYRARDYRLGREVAIKILPAAFASDPERLARFEREARVLAALNHASIATIYGLEQSDGTRFLVLELVPGQTLAEQLAQGALPPDEALEIGRQICGALESAHEKGIVHRDLKPANVKVTPAGKVKVLDFGLAKAFSAEPHFGSDVTRSPTLTSGGTEKGVVLGTAAYMSPEQARGKPVDRRTDVWSFGAVLFEMLVGRRAFAGDTVSDIMVSVLTRDPEWAELPPAVPARVRDLLRRCLQKDPERRLHDIADARLEIEEAKTEPVGSEPVAYASSRRARWIGLAGAATAGAVLAALLVWGLSRGAPASAPPQVTRLARLTHPTARTEWPAWSPDDSLLAYASDRSGNFEIYVRRGETGQDVNVTNDPAQDIQPAFSPDGNSIAFISTRTSRTGLIKIGGTLARNARTYGGDLWVAPALGGAARRLTSEANAPVWRPDGKGVLYISGEENRRSILEVSPGGGTPHPVLPAKESSYEIVRIACSPDGRWVSFETQLEGIFVIAARGGRPRALLTGFSHGWDDAGRMHFVSLDRQGGSRLQVAEIDSAGEVAEGFPKTISLMTASLWDLAVSHDGFRIAVAEERAARNLTRLPLSPGGGAPSGPEEPLSTGPSTDAFPSVSPEGRRVAYTSDVLGPTEVWILDLDSRRRERMQLPGEDLAQLSPSWMPDGRHIVLNRMLPNRVSSTWLVAVDGSGAEELSKVPRESAVASLSPSPNGKTILHVEVAQGVQQIFVLDLATRKSAQLTRSPGSKFDAVWSPDGRSIAVTAAKEGVTQLFRMPASGEPMQQLTTGYERIRHPFFSPDGRWIYFQPSHRNIYRVPAEGGRVEQVTRFPEAGLFLEEPTISPDGRYLYYCRSNGGSSLWLVTLGGSPAPEATREP
jgi:Tol biopolymer transport system component